MTAIPIMFVALGMVGLVGLVYQSSEPGAASLPDRRVLDSHMRAQLAGDWAAAAAFMAEDAVSMPANQPALEGRAAWLAWVESYDFEVIELSYEAVEIDGRADLAYLRGRYSGAYSAEGSAEPIRVTGKFLWVLRKQPDGEWLVTVAAGNSDGAPVETSEE
jgi:ketosteroid isomerase-like protein